MDKDWSMSTWAKNEVRLFKNEKNSDKIDDDTDYVNSCAEAALDVFEQFCKQGHSGYSAQLSKYLLDRLIDGKPLTPLRGTNDEWGKPDRWDNRDFVVYQNLRDTAVFKYVYDDGKVKYWDINRVEFFEPNCDFSSHFGLCSHIVDEMFPITFPYCPGKVYKVYGESFTINPDMTSKIEWGEFNAVDLFEIVTPEGDHITINKRYVETGSGAMVEVTPDSPYYKITRPQNFKEKEIWD